MADEVKVWIAKRKCGKGRVTFHLRWIDPVLKQWKSQAAGDDEEKAKRAAGALEEKLRKGWHGTRRMGWALFIEDHVAKIQGHAHRAEADRVLKEFGKLCPVSGPRAVTFATIERYVAKLNEAGNSVATVNKKLRYLRAAFNKAVKRGYAVANPMADWQWTKEEELTPRVISQAEEASLVKAAEAADGRVRAFIETAILTGGRRGELLGLLWEQVKLDPVTEAEVQFIRTKGKKPRRVPIGPELVKVLWKLKAQTQQDGGPFRGWTPSRADKMFRQAAKAAGCADITIHDCRRTFVTRLIRRGVELTAVKDLAGHDSLETTLRYYNAVHSPQELREAVSKLAEGSAG